VIKYITCEKREAGMSQEDFAVYWRNHRRVVVKSVLEFIRHVRKYVWRDVGENGLLVVQTVKGNEGRGKDNPMGKNAWANLCRASARINPRRKY
jgi:hypothetical protein